MASQTDTLHVINHDNRGTVEVPFGFVYFNDHTRVGYTGTKGADATLTGGWETVTPDHVEVADRYLYEQDLLRTS